MTTESSGESLTEPTDQERRAVDAIIRLAGSMPPRDSKLAAHVLLIAMREKRRLLGVTP